ncbi:hypothetical protein [Methylobacterium sp. CM6257]
MDEIPNAADAAKAGELLRMKGLRRSPSRINSAASLQQWKLALSRKFGSKSPSGAVSTDFATTLPVRRAAPPGSRIGWFRDGSAIGESDPAGPDAIDLSAEKASS